MIDFGGGPNACGPRGCVENCRRKCMNCKHTRHQHEWIPWHGWVFMCAVEDCHCNSYRDPPDEDLSDRYVYTCASCCDEFSHKKTVKHEEGSGSQFYCKRCWEAKSALPVAIVRSGEHRVARIRERIRKIEKLITDIDMVIRGVLLILLGLLVLQFVKEKPSDKESEKRL